MVLAILGSGVGAAAFPAQTRAEDLTLRVGTTQSQTTSSVTQWGADLLYMRLSYSGLAALNYGGTVSPEFAESWTTSADGLTWTFKIRPGMKWSDGVPADANDVVFTLNYMLKSIGDPNELHGFVNPGFWLDSAGKSEVSEVSAPDPLTVVVKTKTPRPSLLWKIFVILPQHIWKDVTYEQALSTFQAEPPIVGSGPFILTEWAHERFIRLTRNDYWWGPKPAIKDILIVSYKTRDAEIQALQAGEIDLVLDASLNEYDKLISDPNIDVVVGQSSSQTWLDFNAAGMKVGTKGANTDAVADPAFRDAIGYAMDQRAIIDKVYGGHAELGVGFIAPVDVNYDPMTDIARRFDLAEAGRRLDAAGYKLGSDGVRLDKAGKPLQLRLVLNSGGAPELATTAQFVVGWLDQLGVKVTPVAQDEAAYYDTIAAARAWELTVKGFSIPPGPMAPMVVDFYEPPNCGDCWWPQAFKDTYDIYARTTDPVVATDLLRQLARMTYQDAPFLILTYPNMFQAYRTDKITGWTQTPAGTGPLLSLDGFSAAFPLFTGLTPVGVATPEPTASASATAAASVTAVATPSASAVPGPGTAGTSDATLLLVGACVVVLLLVGGAFLMRRRRTT